MSLGPMCTFDTTPPMRGQFKQGADSYSLSSVATTDIKVHLWNEQLQQHKFGKGTIAFTVPEEGRFTYAWSSSDTDTPGIWDVWAELLTDEGPLSSTNTEPLEIVYRNRGYQHYGMGRISLVEEE